VYDCIFKNRLSDIGKGCNDYPEKNSDVKIRNLKFYAAMLMFGCYIAKIKR